MESTKISALLVLAMLALSSPTVVLACSPASGCGSGTPSSGTPSAGGVSIPPAIGGVVGTVTPIIGGAAPVVGGVVGKVTPVAGGAVPTVGGVVGKVTPVVGGMVPTVGGVVGKVTPVVGGAVPAVGGMVSPIVGTVGGVVGGVPAVGGVVTPVIGVVAPIIGGSPSPKSRHGGRKACPPSPPTPTPSPPTPAPTPPTPTPSPTPSSDTCPIDTLKLGVCLDLLGNELHIGDASVKCCPLVEGIAGLTAAACLCTAIKAKVLNLALYVPLALQLLVNDCGCAVPPGYTCA
ncbi:hypothetical protein CFC21_032331 [Triticum aestivum]|uniref:Bifunctional inhibitor/plant lipid transfer protein/seed storage helical domain-containing protein n=2 Tax=Triticum aestivum TaxID=4565 RepID=A0A3B6DKP9_WHEAT|nr:36.4 kDa proline-rich protein-like [Triticum aestivum]KAF7019125.1 hypothetical protein CFC21_032331 [Triticum aestivum]